MTISINQLITKIFINVHKKGISTLKIRRIERQSTVGPLLSGHPQDFED